MMNNPVIPWGEKNNARIWAPVRLLVGLFQAVRAAQIIYLWRATTAIVKSGETFEVWFDADERQAVSSVELRGPYHTVRATYRVQEGGMDL